MSQALYCLHPSSVGDTTEACVNDLPAPTINVDIWGIYYSRGVRYKAFCHGNLSMLQNQFSVCYEGMILITKKYIERELAHIDKQFMKGI